MCLFQRIAATSFNLSDWRQKPQGNELKRKRWDDVAVPDRPPLLEWFAYCMTPYGSFSNPFLEFKLFSFVLDCGSRPLISDDEHKHALSRYKWSFLHAAFQLWGWHRVYETVYDTDVYLSASIPWRLILMMAFTHVQLGRYFPTWYCIDACFYASTISMR
jgi:hypothetical protein